MKQFFVFIHSKFSQPSVKCETIIKSLPSDLNFNFLCVDNIETRRIIQEDTTLDIKVVPCLLIVNTEGTVTKFEGRKCYDYLIQYQKQQTPLEEPEPISFYTTPPLQSQVVHQQQQMEQPHVITQSIQQQQQPIQAPPTPPLKPQPQPQHQLKPHPQNQPQPQPQQQHQLKPQPQPQPQSQSLMIMNDEDGNFNHNPTDGNQTSLLDDDEEIEQPPPSPAIKKQTKGKTSLIAQATAMQKSRLIDDEFVKKK